MLVFFGIFGIIRPDILHQLAHVSGQQVSNIGDRLRSR